MEKEVSIESIKLILDNSRLSLSNNLSSFDTNNTKAGIFISISSFSVPLFLNVFSEENMFFLWIFYLFIPIFLNILGLLFFIIALKTKKVDNGVSHLRYEDLLHKTEKEILLFEIAANRDSIIKNTPILEKQDKYINNGLYLTLIGLSIFTILYMIYLTTN